MYRESLLESLTQQIYEAAVGALAWSTLLVSLAGALDSGFPSLYFVDPGSQEGSIAISVGLDEQTRHAYEDHYHERNVWIQGAAARDLLRPGIVRSSHDLYSRKEFLRSEWYADFCRPLNWTQSLAGTILRDGTATANIAVFADTARPNYGKRDIALLRALMPHLRRGLRMHTHLAASYHRGQALEAVLHELSTPILLVDAEGKIFFANAAAERLIRTPDSLFVEDGKLRAVRPEDSKWLRTLIAGAAHAHASHGREAGGRIRLSRISTQEPLEAFVSPLPSLQDGGILQRPHMAAVFIADRSRATVVEESLLIRLHRLTSMEAKVAVEVSRGLSGREISQKLKISYNTLKTHLKHIYAKTDTRHQRDLVRILARDWRVAGNREES